MFPAMAMAVNPKSFKGTLQEDRPLELDDPVCLLRNEHSLLLGKLRLLEQGDKAPGAVEGLLQTLVRDSDVHFTREAFLLRALAEKLEFGGRSFHRLIEEHEILMGMARQLILKSSVGGNKNSKEGESQGTSFEEFALRYRDHIHHVEKVVYVLARTRLSRHHQQQLAKHMLRV